MQWNEGDWAMVDGQALRIDGFETLELEGVAHSMARVFSVDEGMPLMVPVGNLAPLPDRATLDRRRERLLEEMGPLPRDVHAREAELAAVFQHRDADAAIEVIRKLRASKASVDNPYEQILYRRLLPLAVTPIAVGLGEEPVELAALAGIGVPRLRPFYPVP